MASRHLGDLLMSFGYTFDATSNPSEDFGEGLWRSGEPAGIHLGEAVVRTALWRK